MTRLFAGPAQYIQGSGVFDKLGHYTAQEGNDALFIADDVVLGILQGRAEDSFAEVDANLSIEQFNGECTPAEISRLVDTGRTVGCDVVIGAGGGKSIDTAKATAEELGCPIVSVPTIAATDAPISCLSITYNTQGRFTGAERHKHHPAVVLVDTEVVAAAPARWLLSGIGDAFATSFEARAATESGGTNVFGASSTYASRALAEACHDVLQDHAKSAIRAVEVNAVTESVEATVEAIVLLSGLGFENAGLAAAHGVHDGLASIAEIEGVTHGEKVAIGLLVQLVLEGKSVSQIESVRAFLSDVGLPVTLTDLGVEEPSSEVFRAIGEGSCHSESPIWNEPFDVTPEMVIDSLKTVSNWDSSDNSEEGLHE